MIVQELALPEVKLIIPTYFEDYRGYYCETYSKRTLLEYGIKDEFIQDNHFCSLKRGTVRGIHFQNNPYAQAKLVRCTKGSMVDVAVDLRKESATYKRWVSVILSAENRKQIYIPKGFGHCCIALEDYTEGQYKVDAFYQPTHDRAIAWNDPDIAITWGLNENEIIVSPKDKAAPFLKDSDVNF